MQQKFLKLLDVDAKEPAETDVRVGRLHCSSLCKECHGINCENVAVILNEENDDNNYNRNFMDAFLD